MLSGRLDTEWIRDHLQASRVGRRIIHLDTTIGTNEEVWLRSEEADADGLVVFAEEQTAGRGRFGRSWLSPRGASVMASVVLVDTDGELSGSALALIAAVAARDAILASTGIDVDIKWPNDLLIGGRKVGGVLIETRTGSDRGRRFVVGVGINCLQQRGHFTGDLSRTATSLDIESDERIDRSMVALRLLQELDGWVCRPRWWSDADLREAWLTRCRPLGRRIHLQHAGRRFSGHVVDVDPTEALIVELDGGGRRAFSAANTTVLDPPPADDGD